MSTNLTTEQIIALATEAATQAVMAALGESTPAPAKADQPKADNGFVTWLHETADARKARQVSNRAMAAWLRDKNLPTNGPVWDAAKHGERRVTVLRKIAKAA